MSAQAYYMEKGFFLVCAMGLVYIVCPEKLNLPSAVLNILSSSSSEDHITNCVTEYL